MAKRIVVTGATGLIGSALLDALGQRGDQIVGLTRDAARAPARRGVTWVSADLTAAGPWQREVDGAAAVVHLAGASIAGERWSARHKQAIRDSRVESTHRLVEAIGAAAKPVPALICASGIDYYAAAKDSVGDDIEIHENAPAGTSFLARVCDSWEAEAVAAEAHGARVVRMRTGVVLAPRGGALPKLRRITKLGAGGRLGSGEQWFSWIHLDDAVAIYLRAIDDATVTGPINLVAPETVRQREFAKALGKALNRPTFLPTPAFALRAAVGELADYLLTGRNAVPTALTRLGYVFQRPTLAEALRDVDA